MNNNKAYDKLMNERLFELSTSEVYNKVIPKYYTQVNKGDAPRMNGVKVTWEEYLEAHPEYVPDEEFVPEMVYNPDELNEATSMEPCAAIVDYIDNNVNLSIANPETAYPEIIDIISGYIDLCQYYPGNQELQRYKTKAEAALIVIKECYGRFLSRLQFRKTGTIGTPESAFDRIAKTFLQGE